MSNPKDGMKYFMPLTKGLPKDGPTTSVFSVPRVQYSKETEAVVKNLMRESRLTFTQKHVFETILRNGQSLPEHPSQMMHSRLRQVFMQQCHRNKAHKMGIPLLEEEISRIPKFRNHIALGPSAPTRRSLETIRASGDLQCVLPPRTCIPASKEDEKDRLAHKMAFGKDKDPDKAYKAKVNKEKRIMTKTETIEEMKQQRFEELIDEIQDRMQFLLSMDKAKKGKEYRDFILSQISDKLLEMKQISPEKEKEVRECLQLDLLDKRYSSSFAKEHCPSKFFDERVSNSKKS